jgi:Galactose oxidase, central domain
MVCQNDKALWSEVEVVGEKPRERYGHTLTYTHPNLILFGGNTDRQTVNDSWCLNTSKPPFQWVKLQINGKIPAARVYHSAALCQHKAATGMIVIFGGRNASNVSLQDTWGKLVIIRAPQAPKRTVGLGRGTADSSKPGSEGKIPAHRIIFGHHDVHCGRQRR